MNWSNSRIDDLCEVRKGEQLNKMELESSGEYPCINGGIEPSGYTDKWNRSENVITISEGGNSCGYVNFLQTKFWSGGHCYTLHDLADEIDLRFLYFALKGREAEIMRLRVGSGLPNIQKTALNDFRIDLPNDVGEQKRISMILSTVDAAIEQTQALIEKYGRIKHGLMQDLLTRGIDEHGNIRSKQTHKFTIKNGVEVPDEWEVYEIGQIAEHVASGITPKGGSNVYGHSGVMLLRSQNVLSGAFSLDDVAFISEEINQRMKRSQLEIFDVLLNITGASIGRSHFVPEDFPQSNVNQHVCAIRLKNRSKEKSVFVSAFLNDYKGQIQIRKFLGASNREGLNFQQIREIRIPMPRIDENEEFERIERIIDSIDDHLNCEIENLNKTNSLKKGLMQDLLSGRRCVKIDV